MVQPIPGNCDSPIFISLCPAAGLRYLVAKVSFRFNVQFENEDGVGVDELQCALLLAVAMGNSPLSLLHSFSPPAWPFLYNRALTCLKRTLPFAPSVPAIQSTLCNRVNKDRISFVFRLEFLISTKSEFYGDMF